MAKTTPVQRAANRYLIACEEEALAKDNKNKAAEALVKTMRDKKCKEVQTKGVIITCDHVEQDLLKVKKPKQ